MKADAQERGDEIASEHKRPLDVRIVAYFFYAIAYIRLVISILLAVGVAQPADSHRVLLGAMVISSGLADAIYVFCTGLWLLFCARGLMRNGKFAWWLTLAYLVYDSTDAALTIPKHPVNAVIWIALNLVGIAWLWFRRGLYGVCHKNG